MFPVSQKVRLKNGSLVCCRAYGKSGVYPFRNFIPVVFFHGNMNSSKFLPAFLDTDKILKERKVRWYTFDRPGVGESEYVEDLTYTQFAEMMLECIDRVIGKARKVALVGFSSGGPYALATSILLGERVTSLSLISSDVQYFKHGHPLFDLKTVNDELLLETVKENVTTLSAAYGNMKNVQKKAICMSDLLEAIAQGYNGILQDVKLEISPWDFDLKDFNSKTELFLWHGLKDKSVDKSYIDKFILELKQHEIKHHANLLESESHSLIRRHFASILDQLCPVFTSQVELLTSL